jgi:myo-inositol-1(or 4)-monophosphatase
MMDQASPHAAATGRPYAHELAVARAVAEDAGDYLLGVFGTVTGQPKADGTLVSEADIESNRRIIVGLQSAYPDDEIVSEEIGTAYLGGRRVWIVDPLDGTANYCHKVPVWGTTLALIEDGRPVVGVSHFPTLGFTCLATRGGGAWQKDRPLHVDTGMVLTEDDLIAHCSRTLKHYQLNLPAKGRMLGSAALNYALVAAGAVRASIERTARIWDLAAGWLLVEEAGGVVERLDGPPIWPLAAGEYRDFPFATLSACNAEVFAATRAGVRARA